MAITGLFTQSRPLFKPNDTGDELYFDAILEESSELITDVTEFPIEDGSVGNDHAVQRPLTLTMRVGISDNIFRVQRARAGDTFGPAAGNLTGAIGGAAISGLSGQAAALAGIGTTVASAAFQAGQESTVSETALTTIRDIQRRKQLLTVTGAKREYTDMIIAGTRQETNKQNEQALDLVVEMKQLIIVNSTDDSGNVPAANDPAATQAQPEADLGLVSPQ